MESASPFRVLFISLLTVEVLVDMAYINHPGKSSPTYTTNESRLRLPDKSPETTPVTPANESKIMNVAKLCFLQTLLFFRLVQVSISVDTITSNQPIKDGDVIVSSGNIFALGFFSPGNSVRRYVGIWYNQIPVQTVVWVANRDNPINDTSGVLTISSLGNLVLCGRNQTVPVWHANVSDSSESNTIAQLLDTGNLVLARNNTGQTLWQSFDHPSATMLPYMKIGLDKRSGLNRFLTSWKSWDNPATGDYTFRMELDGFPQLFLYKGEAKWWRVGSWTGKNFLNATYIDNEDEVSMAYSVTDPSMLTRIVVNESGNEQRLTWSNQENRWIEYFAPPKEPCDFYGHCGSNSNCNPYRVYDEYECTCLPGFEPKSPSEWFLREGLRGCVRKPQMSTCRRGDGFIRVAGVKVPDMSVARVDMSLGLEACKHMCLRNCSCLAYTSAYAESESNGRIGCLTYHGDMMDTRTYINAGQDLYVRVDAAELVFDLSNIAAATNDFSSDNKLGEGGFGSVYKGVLQNGKEIAVKRLSRSSGQGIEEFKTEIALIAQLQHRNLVSILDEAKRSLLDWSKRFEIICGIARGILYLHQDSRLRIIHRDLKASNVLLDAAMNPKISDFGMARIFGGDQIEENTNRVVGTYGYMAPEYAMEGLFSTKSDVYSFGVLLLEIILGRRNNTFHLEQGSGSWNLVGHVWDLWKEGTAMEAVDKSLGESCCAPEILRCIHLGLLCVQEQATDRPNMSAVVSMLGSDNAPSSPKHPAFIAKGLSNVDEFWTGEGVTTSVNDLTITAFQPR
ncbi:G-type lectin S-receptor-like serine/threonine-protein kinase RKS1 [Citrus sinensis]|uniref:G-type lectin S-receptor-like serine/threonine-protein kinase RKS1 n=1 Tax=Citrus sinensis TaxID=2711 RepID=A0ACB8NEM7_CITSI|nr:G-type lectin S-receptor-like serine/threonine-protein kinase RKS1 [Citrus sinensis]